MKRLFGSYTWKDVITDLVYCVVGSALVGLSLSMFTIPNDIAPGGVSGLSTALAYITPIRVSIWNLMLNVPLLLCAWKLLGPMRRIAAERRLSRANQLPQMLLCCTC